jgi:hypothetical protein
MGRKGRNERKGKEKDGCKKEEKTRVKTEVCQNINGDDRV